MDINARLEKLERENLPMTKIDHRGIDMDNRGLTGNSYDEMTHDEILREHRRRYPFWEATKSVSKGLGWMGALFFGMYWMGYFLTPEKQHLAEKYQVSQDAVFIAPKPPGCDSEDARVGNKHCHFDRKEGVERDNQGNITAVYVTWEKVQE
jgi:hypothetical protein